MARPLVLQSAFEPGNAPDSTMALERPPQAAPLQHREHRSRWMSEAAKAVSHHPHHEVEDAVEGAGERVAWWIAEHQCTPGMIGGRSKQALVVRVTAHDAMHDHDVGRLDRLGMLSNIVDMPVNSLFDTRLLGEPARLVLVPGREFQIAGPCRTGLQELDLDLADTTANFEDGGALDPAIPKEIRILRAVLSSPRFRYLLAMRRANRLPKKRW